MFFHMHLIRIVHAKESIIQYNTLYMYTVHSMSLYVDYNVFPYIRNQHNGLGLLCFNVNQHNPCITFLTLFFALASSHYFTICSDFGTLRVN